jgi:dihydropteroate synthase
VPVAQEIERVLPIIRAIKANLDVRISIDTMNSETARAAVEAGADIINDVSGGLADPKIFEVAAQTGATIVISHWRGHSNVMNELNEYADIAKDVAAELQLQIEKALAAGVARDKIVIDPGLGFAKDVDQNWKLLEELGELQQLGLPVLIGASRKRFIAARLQVADTTEARDEATAELMATLTSKYSLWGLRIHNVRATKARQN